MPSRSYAPSSARRRAHCLLGVLTLAAAGCGAGRGDVSGKVTNQGAAVVYGTVTIVDSEGTPHQGTIQPDGTYSVSGVAPGGAKIGVASPEPPGRSRRKADIPRGDDPERYNLSNPELSTKIDGKKWRPLPPRFADPNNSGLTVTVSRGPNQHDIELR